MNILSAKNVSISYGDKQVLFDTTLAFKKNQVTAIIGPSGCGKSTLLRSFNRMNDFVDDFKFSGEMYFDDINIYEAEVVDIRTRIGMVFQKPNPFPKSIAKNITWGPKIHGRLEDAEALVEDSLRKAALWDEVKDRLNDSALALSGGQQQRLCIARTIAMKPDVILMDEPCSALDPHSTSRIEDLISSLRKSYTIVIVTHNMQQAARVSDETAFLCNGKLIEFDATKSLFTNPKEQQTEDYITGRFG